MRYSVLMAGLLKCQEHLEQCASRERQEIAELEAVIARLSALSGMDGVTARLRSELQRMEEQVQLLLAMAQAAARIYRLCLDMENAIIDRLDCPFRPDETLVSPGAGPAIPEGTCSVEVSARAVVQEENFPVPVDVRETDLTEYVAVLNRMDVKLALAD